MAVDENCAGFTDSASDGPDGLATARMLCSTSTLVGAIAGFSAPLKLGVVRPGNCCEGGESFDRSDPATHAAKHALARRPAPTRCGMVRARTTLDFERADGCC